MSQFQFYIRSSNRLSALAADLVQEMRRNKPGIFQPVYIVTQTEGMNNWLREKIAGMDGISANIEFLRPNDLINKIFIAAGGKFGQSLSANELSWLLYDALQDAAFQKRFPEVKSYYDDHGKTDDSKRIELARKLADIFDQYQVYRQDVLKEWENDKLATNDEEERWQKDLWLSIKNKAGNQFPSKAVTGDFILQQCNDPAIVSQIKKQFPAIFIFGTVLITEYHRELLLSVSRFVPVFLFLPNPVPDIYWYEDKSKREIFYQQKKGKQVTDDPDTNPLLLDCGKLIQNTFQLLFKSDEAINLYETVEHEPFKKDTLLHSIQYYLTSNAVPETGEYFTDNLLRDQTVVIQSCHSVAREVQTLYNYLVRLVDKHPGIYSARDIVVHVTDINLYASYIRSVFDNAPYRFRYTIADESYTSSDSLIGALYELLSLDEKDLTAEAVLQLLDFSCIRHHYQISGTDFIRATVYEANIRHGINGEFSNDSVYVSWKYGLKRIMYGICISGAEGFGEGLDRFFPLDTIEGSAALDVIHFCYFAEKLIHFIEEKNKARSLQEWTGYVMDVMDHFIFDDERDDAEEYRMLIKLLENISNIESYFPQKISYPVFAKQFLPQLNNAIHEYKYSTGGITFCSLIPMRSIPFSIVAMLGLDFDKFPRKENKTGFDLMTLHPRAGDRNLKVNDKHLFMETMLSAGDYLYLSYKGQSILDNSTRPPSILLDQLIAFIESHAQNSEHVLAYLLTKQPLHNFSNLYGNKEGYYNYLLAQKNTVDIHTTNPSRPPDNDSINVSDFIAFFKDPIKFYYNKTLHIYYEDESYTLPEVELFDLNHLERWMLRKEWLHEHEESLEDFTFTQIQLGNLPLKNSGRMEMQSLAEEMELLKEEFEELTKNETAAAYNVSLKIGDDKLEGTIENVYGDRILYPCLSSREDKHLLSAYLIALIAAASSAGKEIIFLSNITRQANRLSMENAQQHLSDLIDVYREGSRKAIFFNPEWGVDIEKIRKLTLSNFQKINKYSPYYLKETEEMDEEEILIAYKASSEIILKGFQEIF